MSTTDQWAEAEAAASGARSPDQPFRVLLYSDDRTVRELVVLSTGRRAWRGGPRLEWVEAATHDAVVEFADAGGLDLLVLDGEAAKSGGMGLCRQLKNEIYRCPPIVVLTGRPQDAWLASWSLADAVVAHPLDPVEVRDTIRTVLAGAVNEPA